MSDDPTDPDRFLLQFPLWFLVHPEPVPDRFVAVDGPSGEKFTALFTDKDLAERYRGSDPKLASFEPGLLEDPQKLLSLLGLLERRSFTHVLIDPTRRAGLPFSIALLRSAAEQAWRERAGDEDPSSSG